MLIWYIRFTFVKNMYVMDKKELKDKFRYRSGMSYWKVNRFCWIVFGILVLLIVLLSLGQCS